MPIAITCAGCGKNLKVKDEWAGKKGKCPQCGTTFSIPAPGHATKSAWGSASAAAQEKKKAQKVGAPVQISTGLIAGIVILGLVVLGVILFLTGPRRVWNDWEALGTKPNDDVESVISKALQAHLSEEGDYDPGSAHGGAPSAKEVLFYRPTFKMKMPDAVDFQGVSSVGEFKGKYHPATGEVEADVDTGFNEFKRGVGVAKNTAPKIKVTGRVKDGKTTVEVNGKPAELVYRKHIND